MQSTDKNGENIKKFYTYQTYFTIQTIVFYLGGRVSKVPSHLKEVTEGQRSPDPKVASISSPKCDVRSLLIIADAKKTLFVLLCGQWH